MIWLCCLCAFSLISLDFPGDVYCCTRYWWPVEGYKILKNSWTCILYIKIRVFDSALTSGEKNLLDKREIWNEVYRVILHFLLSCDSLACFLEEAPMKIFLMQKIISPYTNRRQFLWQIIFPLLVQNSNRIRSVTIWCFFFLFFLSFSEAK